MKGVVRLLSITVLGLVIAVAATGSAAADGWKHWNKGHRWHHDDDWGENGSNFFLGLNFGFPSDDYSAPTYYSPPPVYYTPPSAYYVPSPNVVYGATPGTCVQVNGGAVVASTGQPFYGLACLGGDGRWHIAN